MPDESRSTDVEEPTKTGRQKRGLEGPKGEPDVTLYPTPLWISRRTRAALVLAVLRVLSDFFRVCPQSDDRR